MASWSWCAGRPSLLCRCRSHGTQSCAPATRIVSPSTTPSASQNKTQHRCFCSRRHMFYFKQSSLPGHLQTASARTSLTMTMWSFAPTITSQPTMVRWEHWQIPDRSIWSSGRQFDVYVKLKVDIFIELTVEEICTQQLMNCLFAARQQVLHRQCQLELSRNETFDQELGGDHPKARTTNKQTNKQTNKGKDKKHGYTFLFPRRMKKISDGLIHYRRSSESSSITSSSAGLVFLLSSTAFITGRILILMAATHNCEVFY